MSAKKPKAQPTEEIEPVRKENQFSKDQLIASDHFRGRQDIVNALLSSDETYTVDAVEKKINQYMKGKVK